MDKKNTLFVGKVSHHFDNLPSTNEHATLLLSKSTPSEGTLVITDNQTRGRGQIGSSWHSAPGENLTFSVILRPRFLLAREQFALNRAVSVAVCQAVSEILGQTVKVKWPNDIYVGDKKVCGLLIQNTISGTYIQNSIIGIGLNVNQKQFPTELPNPTSLSLEAGKQFELEEVLSLVCLHLEQAYLQLKNRQLGVARTAYRKLLFRRGENSLFEDTNGQQFRGSIVDVLENGRLQIESSDGEVLDFAAKEVSYII